MARFLPVLLVLVIGGASGFGLGYTLKTPPEPPVNETFSERLDPTPAPSQSGDSETDGERPAKEKLFDDELVKTIADALPAENGGGGDGKFTGIVRQADGSPLAGVRVWVRIRGTPEGYDGHKPDEVELNEYLRQLALYYHYVREQYREMTTDADGEFQFRGLADKWFDVLAELDGYAITPKDGRNLRFKPPHHIEMVAHQVASVPVEVRMPDGTLAKNARISFNRSNNNTAHNWTPENESVQLRSGAYTVIATQGDEFKSESARVRVNMDESIDTVSLTLVTQTGIRGTVYTPDDEAISYLRIKYVRIDEKNADLDEDKLLNDVSDDEWAHGTPAKFHLRDLSPGTYLVGVGRHHRRWDVKATVTLATGIEELELTLPPLDREQVLIAWVYDEHGDPVTNASFQFDVVDEDGSSRGSGGHSVQREDGSIWVVPPARAASALDGSMPGQVSVIVRYGGMQQAFPLASGGELPELTVHFQEPASVTVTLTGVESTTGMRVALAPVTDEEERHRSTSTNKPRADGTFEVEKVSPGSYEVIVSIDYSEVGEGWGYGELARQPVEISSGENPVSVAIPPLYSFTIVVPDYEGGNGQVQLERAAGGRSVSRKLDDNGEAHFTNVIAGEYRLQAWGEAFAGYGQQMTIAVPGTERIVWEPQVISAMSVSITDPEGWLAGLGFEDGDLIIGIGEDEFEGLEHLQLLMAGVMSQEEASFIVLRGNTRLDVAFIPKEFMRKGGRGGGDMEPTTRD